MSLKDRFDLVIFDWAGTMVDFGCEAPVKALIEAFEEEGVGIGAEVARRDMGKAKRDHVNSLLSYPSVADAWRARHGHAGRGSARAHRAAQELRLGRFRLLHE
jgi:phosphonoacetaldehyde hydrolase